MQYTEMQKEEFREQFMARRRRQLILAAPVILVALSLTFASEIGDAGVFGISEDAWLPFALVFVFGALLFSLKNWRCPACNRYLGKAINPRFCGKCGAPLQ